MYHPKINYNFEYKKYLDIISVDQVREAYAELRLYSYYLAADTDRCNKPIEVYLLMLENAIYG